MHEKDIQMFESLGRLPLFIRRPAIRAWARLTGKSLHTEIVERGTTEINGKPFTFSVSVTTITPRKKSNRN